MSEEWSSLPRNSTNGRILFNRAAPVRWLLRALSPVAPRLVSRIGFRLFRTTTRHSVPPRELPWIDSAEPIELELDGQHLCGWSWGTGPTVLLMHGWGGRGSQMGAIAVGLADAGYRAVALDAPGHGTSAGNLSSLPQFADTVSLAAERLGPLHAVIGHSFGAAGAGWAKHGGLEVERLIFIAAPGDLHGYLRGFRELLGMSPDSLDQMLSLLDQRFDVRWQECRYATTIAADSTPMLVIHDEGDDETHYSGALEIERAWPVSRLITTHGLRHRRILRDAAVISEVVDFLGEAHPPRVEPRDQSRVRPTATS